MGTFSFRPATRENVGLLIGLAGPSGSGKTFSAMRLAKGLSGQKPFAVLDTEAGRAKHYADVFRFDHGDLQPPFSPQAYMAAIEAADKADYPVIVVDSMSHEHAGEGGLLDWHEAELTRMAGTDYQKREACKMAAWIQPKMAHKQMVQRLLQVRAHLIFCFRAEEKIKMERVQGKMQIIPQGWMPICEKNLPYEMTVSFLLTPDHPGFGNPIKLQEQHKPFFNPTQPLDESAGEQLGKWASGGQTKRQADGGHPATFRAETTLQQAPDAPAAQEIGAPTTMTDAEWTTAITTIDGNDTWANLKTAYKLQTKVTDLRRVKADKRMEWLAGFLRYAQQQGVEIIL